MLDHTTKLCPPDQRHAVRGNNRGLLRVLLLPPDHQETLHNHDQLPAPVDGHRPEHGDLQRRTGTMHNTSSRQIVCGLFSPKSTTHINDNI